LPNDVKKIEVIIGAKTAAERRIRIGGGFRQLMMKIIADFHSESVVKNA
jgi:hypothetical protein